MVPINLYYPGEINVSFDFPTEWNELDEKELLFIAKIFLEENEENSNQTRPLIIRFIIEHRVEKENRHLPEEWFAMTDAEQLIIDVYPLLDFIFEKNDLTQSPTIFGRKQSFENITCGEFEDSELAAFEFSQTNDISNLADIASIIFRPKFLCLFKPRPYMRYNSRTDTYRTYRPKEKKYKKLKAWQLYAVFIWYAASKHQLQFIFPDLYNSGKKSNTPDPMLFTNTIHAGAGPKNGSRNQIRCMKLYEFLYDCNQEAKKAAEMEAEYQSHK